MPDTERHRVAALASLSSDAAVGGILVYMIKWLVESINKCLLSHTMILSALLDAVLAILDNEAIFLEPYVSTYHLGHQDLRSVPGRAPADSV